MRECVHSPAPLALRPLQRYRTLARRALQRHRTLTRRALQRYGRLALTSWFGAGRFCAPQRESFTLPPVQTISPRSSIEKTGGE